MRHTDKEKCRWSLCLVLLCLTLTGCSSSRVVWHSADTDQTASAAAGTASADADDVSGTVGAADTAQPGASDEEILPEEETTAPIRVHVCGAVMQPGVYLLSAQARLIDAVEAAGGFTQDADTEWCNQARSVADQEQVRIYTREETALLQQEGQAGEAQVQEQTASAAGTDEASGRINLNTATAEQLQTLSGIGPSKAAAIIAWREEHGPFGAIEDIMNISGIKEALFSQIKDSITV